MDDSDTPTDDLQIEPQDRCHPGDSVEGTVAHVPSASDENENQFDGGGPLHLSNSDNTMGRTKGCEQDSLNNNESCLAICALATSENLESTPFEGPKRGQAFSEEDKAVPGKRSTRGKRGTARRTPPGDTCFMQGKMPSAATQALGEEEVAGVNANDPPEVPKSTLQPLFSLIQSGLEQLDSRALPLCLHQIAESYFQEEDYEKAMKFIQLERLYHEQLLANLSAIQQQWETKWKTIQSHRVAPLRNSEKGFTGEDFERLAELCTTHQDPLSPKHKIAAVEKCLGRKCLTQLTVSEDPRGRRAAARESESETCSAPESSQESQHKEQPQESSPGCNQMDAQADSPGLPVTAGKGHVEELLCSTEATLELHTQSPETEAETETAGNGAGPDSFKNACEDDSLVQAAHTEGHPDVANRKGSAAVPQVVPPGESVREALLLPGSDHIPLGLVSEGKHSQTRREELHLPLEDAARAGLAQLENNALTEPQQPDRTGSDGNSPSQADAHTGSEDALCQNNKTSDLSTLLPEPCMAPEEKGDEQDQVSKETEDYLNSLLEGCLKDTEGSLSHEDNPDDDSDLLQDLSPEEASYSLQESLPSDGSCLSLDDLAKRIEIAEVVPAEGLVSILKKRSDSEGSHSAHMHQKPSKRRVRFQEVDDHLDPEDVGGGSCILLILLCIVTVLLSMGGTALYCAFGDMESPVCTDFADNMDFYYTKLVQGVAEVRHWIYLS